MKNTLFKSKILFYLLSLGLGFSFANNPDPIVNLYNQYFNSFSQEKVYVHLNASVYHTKQSIWYKVYLKNTTNFQSNTPSNLVHVELVDDKEKVIAHQKIKMNKGAQQGDIYLDEKIAPGTYTLRAYTNWMRNFTEQSLFKKEIKIIEEDGFEVNNNKVVNQKIDLQFLPEGGNLVNDVSTFLAFKAVDNNGKGVAVEGQIFDDQNNLISDFKTYPLGFGKIGFTPTPGSKYYATIAQNKIKYPLPTSIEQGYVMNIQKNNENFANIVIKTNINNGLALGRVVGIMRDQVFFNYTINESEQEVNLKIPTNVIENGVVKVIFFDKNLVPQCERMIFVNNETDNVATTINLNNLTTAKREKQIVDITLTNGAESTLFANASMTVINKNNFATNKNNIKTHLLLTSDLKGKIEDPNYYFENFDPKKRYMLDLLMLTQGWSRYNTKDVLKGNRYKPAYKAEKGIAIEGSVSLLKNAVSQVQSKVSISNLGKSFFSDEVETDLKGRFKTEDYLFDGKQNFIIKAKHLTPAVKGKPQPLLQVNLKEATSFKERLDSIFTIRTKTPENDFITADTKVLSEVVVKKAKTDKQFTSPTAMHGGLGTKIILDSTQTSSASIADYITQNSRFALLLGKAKKNTLRTSSDVAPPTTNLFDNLLILVNDQREFSDVLDVISENDVKYVDVLTGTEALVYGADAENGVIAIYTKSPNATRISKNVSNIAIDGFHQAKEFYSPKYDLATPAEATTDIRKALYWQPHVDFDLHGKAHVEFYTDDSQAQYMIEIEGVTENGKPFYITKEFSNQ